MKKRGLLTIIPAAVCLLLISTGSAWGHGMQMGPSDWGYSSEHVWGDGDNRGSWRHGSNRDDSDSRPGWGRNGDRDDWFGGWGWDDWGWDGDMENGSDDGNRWRRFLLHKLHGFWKFIKFIKWLASDHGGHGPKEPPHMQPIPLPAPFVMFGSGLVALGAYLRRRKTRPAAS